MACSAVRGIPERRRPEPRPEPRRVKTSKASRDPDFERKVHDVLGLCINPPDHAMAVSADGRRS